MGDMAAVIPIIMQRLAETEEKLELLTIQNRRLDASEFDPEDMDVFWLIFGGVLVFWMQAGFAMLEVGTVHKKNTKNILIKNMFDASIAALCWWIMGNALAGAGDSFPRRRRNGFAGDKGFLFVGRDEFVGKGKAEAEWFFGWTFAGAAATIVSGAVAERVTFGAYLTYSAVLTSVIYPPVVHMMWANGKFSAWRQAGKNGGDGALFSGCGVIDFAGSGTVHMTGGIAALCGAVIAGPRLGRFSDPNYRLPKGDPVLQSLGVLILWMGWYGFNCVSTLAIVGQADAAAHVAFTTTISAATSCLTCAGLGYLIKHRIDHGLVNNGVLAGLVGITSGCAVVSVPGSLVIGALSAVVYLCASKLMRVLKIDDVVDAVAVHGACGLFGLLAPGFLATPTWYSTSYYSTRNDRCAGILYGGAGGSLWSAFASAGAIIAWVGSMCTILFGVMHLTGMLRVTPEVEEMGMDESKHGGRIDLPGPASPKMLKTTPKPSPSAESKTTESMDVVDADVLSP